MYVSNVLQWSREMRKETIIIQEGYNETGCIFTRKMKINTMRLINQGKTY
jgi:hypothetical protein